MEGLQPAARKRVREIGGPEADVPHRGAERVTDRCRHADLGLDEGRNRAAQGLLQSLEAVDDARGSMDAGGVGRRIGVQIETGVETKVLVSPEALVGSLAGEDAPMPGLTHRLRDRDLRRCVSVDREALRMEGRAVARLAQHRGVDVDGHEPCPDVQRGGPRLLGLVGAEVEVRDEGVDGPPGTPYGECGDDRAVEPA